jgi:hypothetical protein
MQFSLTPAYGRDYQTKAAAISDFLGGKMFVHASSLFTGGGSYIGASDIPPGASVQIRYQRLTKAACFVRGKEPAPASTPPARRTKPVFDFRLTRRPVRYRASYDVTAHGTGETVRLWEVKFRGEHHARLIRIPV